MAEVVHMNPGEREYEPGPVFDGTGSVVFLEVEEVTLAKCAERWNGVTFKWLERFTSANHSNATDSAIPRA